MFTAAERELVDQMIACGRSCVDRKLVLASGGNLSAREPGAERFVVTATSSWLDRLTVDDFAVVGLDGTPVEGSPAPSSEWKLHQRTYRVRPDVNAVVHVHPQYAVLVAATGHPIRMLTLDHAVYVGSVGHVGYFPNGSDELADGAAEQARRHDAVVLAHHGCSALGTGVDMALRRALNLEEAATASYRLLLLGDRDLAFPTEELDRIRHA